MAKSASPSGGESLGEGSPRHFGVGKNWLILESAADAEMSVQRYCHSISQEGILKKTFIRVRGRF